MVDYKCGVYRILNKETGRVYIGSSKNLKSRLGQHKNQLNAGKHVNKELQGDWIRYGKSSFIVEPVEYLHDEESLRLFEIERYWLDKFPDNYNVAVIPHAEDVGKKDFFITVVACSSPAYWYRDLIGETLLVVEDKEKKDWQYKLVGKKKYLKAVDVKRHNPGKGE